MVISHGKRFVFLHIPKTRGTSIPHNLGRNALGAGQVRRCGKHGSICDVREQLGDKADEYYSFSVVRNPWDRMVSWYSMIDAFTTNPPWDRRIRGGGPRNKLWLYVAENANSFEEFVLKCTDPPPECHRLMANHLDYFVDADGKMLVTRVARFENLNADMREIFAEIGLKRLDLPHRNKSKHRHYSEYYNDETREVIAERFAKDIEYFGYQFETCDRTLAAA